MRASLAAMGEIVPAENISVIRENFEAYGHVGVHGLVDTARLEAATADAHQVAPPYRVHKRGLESVVALRFPDPRQQAALTYVLAGLREGAGALERELSPDHTGKFRMELIEKERNQKGWLCNYKNMPEGLLSLINLRGTLYHWIDDEYGGVTYALGPGDVIMEDLARSTVHRTYTGFDYPSVNLTVAQWSSADSRQETDYSETTTPR